MNERIALLGAIEIFSALSCGIVILFVTYKLMVIYGKKRLQLDHNNLAYNILIAAVLYSVGLIVSGVIQPILDSFRILSDTQISKAELIISFLAYGGLYILIAYLFACVILMVGVTIYSRMTVVNELDELKDNNIGVAIVLSAIIITLSLMCDESIVLLIESIIPYPELAPKFG